MQHRVSFEVSQPVLQKQVLLDSTYSEDGSSLAELCQPSPVSLDTTEGETPAEACAAWSPLLPHQSPEPGCFVCSHSPSAGRQGGSVRAPGAREDQGAVCQ